MENRKSQQKGNHLGTHGEKYGNWMSARCSIWSAGLLALAVVLAVLLFTVFRITVPGVIFTAAAAVLLALLFWITWIRRQLTLSAGGGLMEGVHHTVLSIWIMTGKGSCWM